MRNFEHAAVVVNEGWCGVFVFICVCVVLVGRKEKETV